MPAGHMAVIQADVIREWASNFRHSSQDPDWRSIGEIVSVHEIFNLQVTASNSYQKVLVQPACSARPLLAG